ncbi:MAG: acyl-CoA dehydrogenase [Actinobacteria bacterium]|nr:acyl-CoA dehydrogenase [Actinomycetota bacterium]
MDFSLTAEQKELQGLAQRILRDGTDTERYKAALASSTGFDLDLWKTLAASGCVGIALPESVGGGGLSFLEAAVVLQEVGRTTAPVPAFAVMALGGPALAAAGREDLLAGVADGDVIVTAAIHEPVGDAYAPTTSVNGGKLSGTKVCVPAGTIAARFVVTAADGLYVVEANAPGVTVTCQDTTTGIPDAMVNFDNAPAEKLGGEASVRMLLRSGTAGACLVNSGACQEALALISSYTTTRNQFGKPIASFQAVSQRAADAYIDTEAVRLTAWQCAWRLAEGVPVDEQLYSAKFWAAEGAGRVVRAAHHLHGGMGVDRDYPLHRYYLLVKEMELQIGSATPSLRRLGASLVGAK